MNILSELAKAPKLMTAVETIAEVASRIYEDTGIKHDLETKGKSGVFTVSYDDKYTVAFQVMKTADAITEGGENE